MRKNPTFKYVLRIRPKAYSLSRLRFVCNFLSNYAIITRLEEFQRNTRYPITILVFASFVHFRKIPQEIPSVLLRHPLWYQPQVTAILVCNSDTTFHSTYVQKTEKDIIIIYIPFFADLPQKTTTKMKNHNDTAFSCIIRTVPRARYPRASISHTSAKLYTSCVFTKAFYSMF